MGKVKDGLQASKASKPSKAAPASSKGSSSKRRFAQFLTNLAKADLYKPMQGRYARLYTALALGVVAVLGLVRLHQTLTDYPTVYQYLIPTLVALPIGWVIFRLVEYPPFVEFLIATEAEMNKVSWTSREDLQRATTVVLTTVLIMAVYLFLVDEIWVLLLQFLGVLKFAGGGAFGSTG